jgi:hypothetical protein
MQLRRADSGNELKVLRWIAVLALVGVSPAFAQDAPLPRPMPLFHAPIASGAAPAGVPAETAALPAETAPLAATPATEAIETVTADPQPVTLTAMVTDGGQAIGEG